MTQGKSRMRQFRTSGSVRGVAREGDSYRDMGLSFRASWRQLARPGIQM
jgi:hypothetical protein